MRISAIIIIALLTTHLAASQQHGDTAQGTLISNATIITASENEDIQQFKGYLLVQGDQIQYVGESRPIMGKDITEIDAEGKFIIPGLIDSHVHIGHTITLKDEHYETKPDLVASYKNQLPRSYLYFGFTSIVDLDLNDWNRKNFLASELHPDLYHTSRGVRYFNGYGPGLFPPALRYKFFPKWIYDQDQIESIPKGIDLNEHTVSAVVQQTVNDQAIGLKTYYEKGFDGVFDWPVPSDSLLSNLIKESHAHDLPVVLHATSLEGYQKGLQHGTDIFAHGLWHWAGDKLNSEPTDEIKTLYESIAKQGSYVQSTMRVILGEYETYTWSLLNHPDLKHALNEDFIQWMSTDEGQWSQRELVELYETVIQDTVVAKEKYLESYMQRVKNTTKLAMQKGVKLIFGTDSPAQEGIGNVPGLNGFLELKALSEAGIDHETIFLSATIRNAVAFNISDKIGSLEEGKKANALILNSDPLRSIDAYNDISQVMIGGNLLPREKLSAIY